MKLFVPTYLFPFTIFAFSAPPVKYANAIFDTTTRWLALAILITYLLGSLNLLLFLRSGIGILLLATAWWTVASASWSEIPMLSLFKSIAFSLISLGLVSAGMLWVACHGETRAFHYILPIAALTFFAALGPGAAEYSHENSQTVIYRGLAGNSNMLGMFCAMSFIGAVGAYANGDLGTRGRRLTLFVIILLLIISVWAKSRASLLIILFTGLGYMIGKGLLRRAIELSFVVWTAVIVDFAFPEIMEFVEFHMIRKGGTVEEGVLFSRVEVWTESFDLALKGGWVGGGYGVTIGETGFSEGLEGLTALGYGREKGNAQLAILEELGIIGLLLYVIFLMVMFGLLVGAFKRAQSKKLKISIGIAFGALTGFVANSVFEAWWVAPGSPEAPFFWGLVGVAAGLAVIAQQDNVLSRRQMAL